MGDMADNLNPGLFSDDYGNPSSMRLLASLIVVVQITGWFYVCIRSGTIPAMDWSNVTVLLGTFGAKVWQKQIESK